MGRIKIVLSKILQWLFKFAWVVPVSSNQVLLYSYDGKRFVDNPKYISDYLKKYNAEIRQVIVREDPSANSDEAIKVVRYGSPGFLFAFLTSRVIVTNNSIPSYLPVRKSQFVLNTWHGGSPLKTCGIDDKQCSKYDIWYFQNQAKRTDAFISSSAFMTNSVIRGSMLFQGEVLELGMPRNSVLLQQKTREDLRDKTIKALQRQGHEVKGDGLIVLYAPTFRGHASRGDFLESSQQIDFGSLRLSCAAKWGQEPYVLFRAHHAMREGLASMKDVIDVSDYPDMQELLAASDVLITDYSSCSGDFCLQRRPVFLYTPDLQDYTADRGFYWDIQDLPFPVCITQRELLLSIEEYSEDSYDEELERYFARLDTKESEFALERTCTWIAGKVKGA